MSLQTIPPQPGASTQLLQSLFVMAWVIEARDPYTGGHLWRVAQFSRLLATAAGLDPTTVARIALGGFLHDLGKVAVPDAILNKPGRLTDDEYRIVQTHPHVGARLLARHPLAPLAHEAVLRHHERPDGTGYPDRLAAGSIGIDARIVGICDAFDAMTSSRPYRRGMATGAALANIEAGLGSQFDRPLGERFLDLGHSGSLDHIVGHSDAGIPLQDCPVCGPTIVVRRGHAEGALVYCRHCGTEARVHREGKQLRIAPTGGRGSPSQLEPEIDGDLIDDLVRASDLALSSAGAGDTA